MIEKIILVVLLCRGSAMVVGGIEQTKRPIIGILTQELSPVLKSYYPNYDSYIAASYVKAVEASAAQVVPIFINQTEQYYRDVMSSINGLLLPGGNTWFDVPNGYSQAGDILYQLAKQANQNGTHFPVMGVCLGFQLLFYLDAGKEEMRTNCMCKNVDYPLDFQEGFTNSSLFMYAPDEIINILKNEAVTPNEHQFCITKANMTKFGLDSIWEVLSLSTDQTTGVTFVSTAERADLPIVGLQYHPEKVMYEWRRDFNHSRSPHAIAAARYFYDWLVGHARYNSNKFASVESEESAIIYNYPTSFSGLQNLVFDEMYLFTNNELALRTNRVARQDNRRFILNANK